MDRRNFLGLGLGLAPLLAAGAAQATEGLSRPMSRMAQKGFLPNIPLVSHTGKRVLFYDDLVRDKIVLLNFFMVRCTDGRCPIAIANLKKVQELLGDRVGRDIFFYSITLQPELDTPEVLRQYAETFDIRPPGWLLLTGRPADIEHLRRSQGYAEADPEIDKDPANHIGMLRYGDDRLERWGAVSARSQPSNIASTFQWLSQ